MLTHINMSTRTHTQTPIYTYTEVLQSLVILMMVGLKNNVN